MNAIVRFFKNKNTVTILGVIAIVAIIYIGYNYQINTQVKPLSVPVAKETIQPRTMITAEMIEYVNMPSAAVTKDVIKASAQIIGKYSSYNSVIPEGSMFFSSVLMKAEDMPDSAFVDVPNGQIPYQFSVNMQSTYGNSIYPGNKIDIYMKAVNDDGVVMVGKLLEDVSVLAVKDSNGNNVFENTTENRTPAYLIFGVDQDVFYLLKKAAYMYSYSVELFPVPHGGTVTTEGTTKVSTTYLKDFINANTVTIESDVEETPKESNTEDKTQEVQ